MMRRSLRLLAAFPILASAQIREAKTIPPVVSERNVAPKMATLSTDRKIAALEKASGADPRNRRVRVDLAFLYLQKVRETADYSYLDLAARITSTLLDEDSGDMLARRLDNEINMMKHEFRRVAASAEDLTKLAPSDPGPWGNLGDALMELGEYERAGQAYQRMFAVRPGLESYNRLAYFKFVTGDPAAAVQLMKLAIEAGSRIPEPIAWCYNELGDMYFKTGRTNEARAAYLEAIRLFPGAHKAHYGLGRVLAGDGKLAEAAVSVKRSQSIVPMVEYAGELEQIYQRLGKPDEAKKQQALIDVVDKLSRARGETANRVLALIYIGEGRKLEDAAQLTENELENRNDVYTLDAVSWVYYTQKNYDDAAKMSVKALRFQTTEPAFYYHAGMIAAAEGRNGDARKMLQRALELNPHFDLNQAPEAERVLKTLSN
jgi:tetratricopeptide (TPR) repeat protein